MKSFYDLKLGWLAPEGTLVVTGHYEHIDAARKLVDALNYSQLDDEGNIVPADDVLLNHGWCMITKSDLDGRFRIGWGWKRFLTQPQKDFLKDYLEYRTMIDPICAARLEEEIES